MSDQISPILCRPPQILLAGEVGEAVLGWWRYLRVIGRCYSRGNLAGD
jgi:hypothetical protein